MDLDIYYENRHFRIDVPDDNVAGAGEFFDQMDRDMDGGWQMGPTFVDNPGQLDRARIAASRLLVAIESSNEPMIQAMSGYIVSRVPGVRAVRIDTQGEMMNTEIITGRDQPQG